MISSKDVIDALTQAGWSLHRTRGSHHQFKHPTIAGLVTVPHPKKDLPIETIISIEKQSQVKLRK